MTLNNLVLNQTTGDLSSAGFKSIYINGMLVGLTLAFLSVINHFVISYFDIKKLLIFFNFIQLGGWCALIILRWLSLDTEITLACIKIGVFFGAATFTFPIIYLYS